MKRKMALDVGDKTIGVAVSDPLGITAQGLMTIERVGIKKDTTKVVDLIREQDCDAVVIGLPLNLNGSDSVQTEKVREFRERLENKLRSNSLADVRVDWQDERFTTVMAEDVLIAAGVRREDRKKTVDRQAAQIILQSWLDRQANLA
ncbi:MAG: Holliday junction resolvase RuvX, partial [Eubacterium sp.]|nr:Holliday junction resolvase RuvX [Eubacterium sp.]